jgi:ADP-L-glycero-D-manno-heptose 6-epimerase
MIVVTGGAGFIGSNLVAALSADGADIIVCDRLRSNDKWRNLAKHQIAGFVEPPALTKFLAAQRGAVQAIVHMGAISSTTVSDGDAVIDANFNFSVALWEWCSKTQVPLVYASSAATYGNGEQGFDDHPGRAALAALRPLNLYGWSKHLFDRWAIHQVEKNRPRPPQWVGLKFFNVYGPNEHHKGSMRSVVAQLYPALANGEPARLFASNNSAYADGGQLRDFVYVDDCIQVVRWLLEHRYVSGIFNVGTGKARSFADLATAAMLALNREPQIHYIPMPENLRGKYQYYTQANMTRLRAAGYTASFMSLENGVEDYVRNYLHSDDPYR